MSQSHDAEDTCGFCRWFCLTSTTAGQCRRRAPGNFIVDRNLVDQWPHIHERDWCGDFEHTRQS